MGKLILLAMLYTGINDAKSEQYEHSLPLLKASEKVVSKAVYGEYWFYRAVAHHQLSQDKEALRAIQNIEDSFDRLPVRYTRLAEGMKHDISQWNKKGLDDISRKMGSVGRRLNLGLADKETQERQKEILNRLDEFIKEKESKSKAQSDPNNGGCPNGDGAKELGKIPGQGQNSLPNAPALDSFAEGGMSGKGLTTERKLREYKETWGVLPPEKRAAIMEEMKREIPAEYKPMVDNYFKSLNKGQK